MPTSRSSLERWFPTTPCHLKPLLRTSSPQGRCLSCNHRIIGAAFVNVVAPSLRRPRRCRCSQFAPLSSVPLLLVCATVVDAVAPSLRRRRRCRYCQFSPSLHRRRQCRCLLLLLHPPTPLLSRRSQGFRRISRSGHSVSSTAAGCIRSAQTSDPFRHFCPLVLYPGAPLAPPSSVPPPSTASPPSPPPSPPGDSSDSGTAAGWITSVSSAAPGWHQISGVSRHWESVVRGHGSFPTLAKCRPDSVP